jgi:thiol-disulfide isomerase/thioredoxin
MKKTSVGILIIMAVTVWTGRAESQAGASGWTSSYEQAKASAAKTGLPILALFTGTDWCPPCKQFERGVANQPEFLGYAKGRVVLLKLDYPQHMLQSPALLRQNEELAERIGGRDFPRFYLLDSSGEVLTKLDTQGRMKANTLIGHYLRSIQDGLDDLKKTEETQRSASQP